MNSIAQIPNGGFESWSTESGIEIPSAPWVTNNLQKKPDGVTYNPVTKSTDHYPENVGSYSIRMENNLSYLSESGEPMPYWACSYGYSTTAFYPGYNGPVFPITGHPNSFCGYYKFLPQQNDAMMIALSLYQKGIMVASAVLKETNTVSNWTSFNIPISSYTVADSAQIALSAFTYPPGPNGNSIFYVDNLSFGSLITSIPEQTSENTSFSLFPNPASDIITLNIENTNNTDLTLNIYNVAGTMVKSEMHKQNNSQINVSDLSNGIYMVEIKSKALSGIQKLIIQR